MKSKPINRLSVEELLHRLPQGWDLATVEDLRAKDDLFWLRDESLEDSANLPDPDVIAEETAEDLRTALAEIEDILDDLKLRRNGGTPSEVATASERPAPQRK